MGSGVNVLCAFALIVGILTGGTPNQPDPTGTWRFTVLSGEEQVEITLRLKYEANLLTGTLQGPKNKEKQIENAKLDGEDIEFSITREPDGKRITVKYSGKLDGDRIKGTTEIARAGKKPERRDWEATRDKQ